MQLIDAILARMPNDIQQIIDELNSPSGFDRGSVIRQLVVLRTVVEEAMEEEFGH